MSNNWAYTAFGATPVHEFAEHFGPSVEKAYTLSSAISTATREAFSQQREILHHGRNLIGFDGKNWIVGRMALPLNPQGRMALDAHGREMHFLHGYSSESSGFPERIPIVDMQHYNDLQQKHIFPIWGKWGDESIRPKSTTGFAPAHAEIAISEHLPQEAIDVLKQAHGEGKPIALHYDAVSKQWSNVEGFERRIRRNADQLAKLAPKPHVSSANNAAADTAKKAAEPTKGWVAGVWKHRGGKLAIIGGTVAFGALVGYWVFKSKREKYQPQIGD
jgi:hypothetical protein